MEMANVRPEKGKSLIAFPEKYVVLDLETTGLSPEWDEIIEIAAIKVSSGAVVDTFESLVKPSEEISDFISKLTGITNKMLSSAPSIESILPSFVDFIGGDIIVGHNVHFDINFLYDASVRNLQKPIRNDFIDTMRLSRLLLPDLAHHRLRDIVSALSVSASSYHRSMPDCDLTQKCFDRMRGLAADKFGSLEAFLNQSTARNYSGHKLDARSISTTNVDFDVSHPLYGKVCVFTGSLDKLSRKEAMQIVVDLGGTCGNGITKDTNYLILGNNNYSASIKDGKSNKLKKAEDYKLKGYDIEVIPENVFYDMLESPATESTAVQQLSPEEEALEIIKASIPGDFTTEQRSSDYISLIAPGGSDFCRIKFTARSSWFSVDCWCIPDAIKNIPLLDGVKNKNQRHWKIVLSCVDDLRKYTPIIAASYSGSRKC